MAQEQFLSTDSRTETTNRDQNVLYRGRISLITSTQGPSSIYAPYYFASHTKDLSFINTNAGYPKVEVWAKTSGSQIYEQCPYTRVDPGTLDILSLVRIKVGDSTVKDAGFAFGLTLELFHKTQNTTVEFYYTVTTTPIGHQDSSLYPNDGTFSA